MYKRLINDITDDIELLDKNMKIANDKNDIEKVNAIKSELKKLYTCRDEFIKKEIEMTERFNNYNTYLSQFK